ncbi:MAG: hypothetical protein M3Q23_17335 [Actinomycetota bacterium]|nr:hypothetical protein [Actinomycetota bacterium]
MGRVLGRIAWLALGVAMASAPAPALAAATATVRASGSVTGDLKAGNVLTVDLKLSHSDGWQNFQQVQVVLRIHGRPLDQLVFDSRDLSLSIIGDGPSASLTSPEKLHGSFFSVNTAGVAISTKQDRLELEIPIRLLIEPPPGARLYYTYAANGVPTVGFKPLTPPVEAKSGFSWGTLGVAIAAALFAGGFLGNLVASNRRRQVRPSVYAAVSKRLEEERARK